MERMIRRERERRGWTVAEVAKSIGVSAEQIRLIETGQRNPSYEVMVKLEDLFGMTHRELMVPIDNEIIPQRGVGSKGRKF